jgi:ankyrin repeat protein
MRFGIRLAALALALVPPAVCADTAQDFWNAALHGDLPRVKALVKRHPRFLRTPKSAGVLCLSAYSGNKPLVEYVLAQGAKVSERDPAGATPLYLAANGGHLEIAKYLVAKGAKVTEQKPDGWTPLHAATASGHTAVVEYLLAKGAPVNAATRRGETPFDLAVKYRNDALAALLQKKGGRPGKAPAAKDGSP